MTISPTTWLLLVLLFCVAYAGWEGTMRLITYIELEIKYGYVKLRMYFMEKRLRRELQKTITQMEKEYGIKLGEGSLGPIDDKSRLSEVRSDVDQRSTHLGDGEDRE